MWLGSPRRLREDVEQLEVDDTGEEVDEEGEGEGTLPLVVSSNCQTAKCSGST